MAHDRPEAAAGMGGTGSRAKEESHKEAPGKAEKLDAVEEASRESFPASDAPAWTAGSDSKQINKGAAG